jgi:plasmid maintenance system antidote protein VapI
MKMELDRKKIDICRARKKMGVVELAEAYGVSRARMNAILNQREVTPVTAGRLADALGVDVTEII